MKKDKKKKKKKDAKIKKEAAKKAPRYIDTDKSDSVISEKKLHKKIVSQAVSLCSDS